MARTIDPLRHAAKRLEILEAANRCFCRTGLRAIAVSEICAEAGISPGHLYHYFDCKDDIIEELAKGRLDTARDSLDAALAQDSPAIEILVDEVTALAAGDRAITAALLFDVLADSARNESIARIVRECHAGMADALCAVLRQGQADGEIDRSLDPRRRQHADQPCRCGPVAEPSRSGDGPAARLADVCPRDPLVPGARWRAGDHQGG